MQVQKHYTEVMHGKKNLHSTLYQYTVLKYNQFTIKQTHKNKQKSKQQTTLSSGKCKIRGKLNQDKANIKVYCSLIFYFSQVCQA